MLKKSRFVFSLTFMIAVALIFLLGACQASPTGLSPSSDNQTYSRAQVIDIAKKASPDCRKQIPATDGSYG